MPTSEIVTMASSAREMRLVLVVTVAAALAACGGTSVVHLPDAPADDLIGKLRALPGVADATEQPTTTPGYRYYVLHFRQPVDHADPQGASFLQEVSLLHKDTTAPLIVWTTGYWDYELDATKEPTRLLGANQISIEHRYFGTSRPDPADWSKLTIEQMADDEHAIVSALRTIYTAAAIASGASKGGMTAVYFRRFYPEDVDGTLAYVAPLSFGAPDARYGTFIAAVGTPDCHQAIRDLAIELISHRRAAMESRAQAQAAAMGFQYTRVALGPAVESAIEGLEWSFWQYWGIQTCTSVPATTADDDTLFDFLDTIAPIHDSDDDQVAQFEAYYYQAYAQLGYPDDGTDYLKPYYQYGEADFAGALPTATPVYDGGVAMHDIDGFVEEDARRLLFVYGQWDPWSGGKFALWGTEDSLLAVEAEGTHYSNVAHLAPADRDAVLARLQAWTGVQPLVTAASAGHVARIPHVPAGLLRALHPRGLSQ